MTLVSPEKWKIGVTLGADELGDRRRTFRTVTGTRTDAARALASLVIEAGDRARIPKRMERQLTVDDLVTWYLEFARDDRGLDHSTLAGYANGYSRWLRQPLGGKRAGDLGFADLDKAFGRMRRAGLSRSRMNNVRALLSGAYRWGKRHGKVYANPIEHFELPTSTRTPRDTVAPELEELLQLLDSADRYDPLLAPVLKLGAVTGLRRGELSGLRRDRLRLERRELVVDRAVNDAGGVVVEKQTKTRRSRVVSIDDATVALLNEHLAMMDERAAVFATVIASDGYVFSLDPGCRVPMRPELLTRRMRQLRRRLGITGDDFDATILALRKWSSSELMDAGFNPSAVSGRQGHTVQVMLHHYSTRRQSADRAAANHLGQKIHGSAPRSTT
jgi:integrase